VKSIDDLIDELSVEEKLNIIFKVYSEKRTVRKYISFANQWGWAMLFLSLPIITLFFDCFQIPVPEFLRSVAGYDYYTLFQVQATVAVVSISILALVTGLDQRTYFGQPVIKHFFRTRRMVEKSLLELMLIPFFHICLAFNWQNAAIAAFFSTCFLAGEMFLRTMNALIGKADLKREIKKAATLELTDDAVKTEDKLNELLKAAIATTKGKDIPSCVEFFDLAHEIYNRYDWKGEVKILSVCYEIQYRCVSALLQQCDFDLLLKAVDMIQEMRWHSGHPEITIDYAPKSIERNLMPLFYRSFSQIVLREDRQDDHWLLLHKLDSLYSMFFHNADDSSFSFSFWVNGYESLFRQLGTKPFPPWSEQAYKSICSMMRYEHEPRPYTLSEEGRHQLHYECISITMNMIEDKQFEMIEFAWERNSKDLLKCFPESSGRCPGVFFPDSYTSEETVELQRIVEKCFPEAKKFEPTNEN